MDGWIATQQWSETITIERRHISLSLDSSHRRLRSWHNVRWQMRQFVEAEEERHEVTGVSSG
jgi:hypothetical protein